MSRLTAAILIAMPLVASAVAEPQKAPANQDAQVLMDFKARIDKYVALRKKADDGPKGPAYVDDDVLLAVDR